MYKTIISTLSDVSDAYRSLMYVYKKQITRYFPYIASLSNVLYVHEYSVGHLW